ncbi:MAG: PAS domain-containing protein [Opitutaceae bacterium]
MLCCPETAPLIAEVTESLTLKEVEVQDKEGRWYSLRLRPYKTAENKIDGVVITLFDIEKLKRTLGKLKRREPWPRP